MPNLTTLKEELNDLITMRSISSALTEASAARLKKIREKFEKNRSFYEEISHLYHLVRENAVKTNPKGRILFKTNNRSVSVAITSNQRFYGNLNTEIVAAMLSGIEKNPTEVIIIGSTGVDVIRSARVTYPYEKIIFAGDFPTADESKIVLDKIKYYEHIYLYYPKFVSLVSQTVAKLDITRWEEKTAVGQEEIYIIFEPEMSKMVEFFETQVRSILFLRVLLETDLARSAARLLTMSMAEERSEVLIKEQHSNIRKMRNSILSHQLLETFSGMKKWKTLNE